MSLLDMFFEPAPEGTTKPGSPIKSGLTRASELGKNAPPISSRGAASAASAMPVFSTASVPDDDPAYVQMKARTDPEQSSVFAELNKYLDPLRDVITDQIKLYQAALATAKRNSGITADKVLGAFDACLQTLEGDKQAFYMRLESETNTNVTAKENEASGIDQKIAGLQSQIADLQAKKLDLQKAVATAKSKVDAAQAHFDAAYDRRKAEIEKQKNECAAILR